MASRGGEKKGDSTYQWRERVPSPKRNHETKPREEEDATVNIDGVEEWYRPSLSIDRVDLRGRVEVGELETHGGFETVSTPGWDSRIFAWSGWSLCCCCVAVIEMSGTLYTKTRAAFIFLELRTEPSDKSCLDYHCFCTRHYHCCTKQNYCTW